MSAEQNKGLHQGQTGEWPPHTAEIIQRNLTACGINVYMGKTNCLKSQLSRDAVQEYDIVVVYDVFYKYFLTWNMNPHRERHAGKTATFSFPKGKDRLKIIRKEIDTIEHVPHPLNATNGAEKGEEVIAVIPPDFLYDFCVNIEDFLDFGKDSWTAEEQVEYERKRDKIHRFRRDPEFRDKILNKYGCCIVCGERERAALEAAHIVAVKDGGNDDLDNGICLCATHHRMYDAGKLNIDMKENKFVFSEQEPPETYWWEDAKKRGYTLLIEK